MLKIETMTSVENILACLKQCNGPIEWFGNGAKALGLHDQTHCVDDLDAIEMVFSGKRPECRTQFNAYWPVYKPAYCLTFVPSKSVARAAQKDERVLEAQRLAVRDTLKFVEEHILYVRLKGVGSCLLYTSPSPRDA